MFNIFISAFKIHVCICNKSQISITDRHHPKLQNYLIQAKKTKQQETTGKLAEQDRWQQ